MQKRAMAVMLAGVIMGGTVLSCAVFEPVRAEDSAVRLPGSAPASDSVQSALSKIKPLSGGVSTEAIGLSDDINFAEAQVQAHPKDPEAWFLMAVAYSRTPYVERALWALDRSRHYAKQSPEGYAVFDRKLNEYEALRLKSPDDNLLLYRLGFAYYVRGFAVDHRYMKESGAHEPGWYYDQAEAMFRELLSRDPRDYQAMNYLGYLLAERDPDKNYQQAVGLWEQSAALSSENPGAYILLGQAAMKKGNLRGAVEYSAKAMKARNDWLEAHNIDPSKLKIRL